MNSEAMLNEVKGEQPRHAPTMGNLAKIRYTHVDIIDFIIANPGISQNQIAARYGYTPAWVSNIMASDAWQAAMAARREEIVDPELRATMDERFRGMTILSLRRLQERLEAPQVSDQVILRAVELGAKACGVGGNRAPVDMEKTVINIFGPDRLAAYANAKLGTTYEVAVAPEDRLDGFRGDAA